MFHSCKTDWFTETCVNVSTAVMNSSTVNTGNITEVSSNYTEICELVSNKGSDSVTEYWK